MNRRTLALAATLLAVCGAGALVACELNPQPLPPENGDLDTPGGKESDDAGSFGGDAASLPAPADSGTGADLDGSVDGGADADGGDGGDAGDAAPDAT